MWIVVEKNNITSFISETGNPNQFLSSVIAILFVLFVVKLCYFVVKLKLKYTCKMYFHCQNIQYYIAEFDMISKTKMNWYHWKNNIDVYSKCNHFYTFLFAFEVQMSILKDNLTKLIWTVIKNTLHLQTILSAASASENKGMKTICSRQTLRGRRSQCLWGNSFDLHDQTNRIVHQTETLGRLDSTSRLHCKHGSGNDFELLNVCSHEPNAEANTDDF